MQAGRHSMVNLKQLAHLSSAACSPSIHLLLLLLLFPLLLVHSAKGQRRSLPSQMAQREQTDRERGDLEDGGRSEKEDDLRTGEREKYRKAGRKKIGRKEGGREGK